MDCNKVVEVEEGFDKEDRIFPETGSLNNDPIEEFILELDSRLSYSDASYRFAALGLSFIGARCISALSEYIVADMLAQIDETHLAASGLITVTNAFFLATASLSLYSTGILQKQSVRTDPARVGNILNVGYLYVLGIGAIESVLLAFALKPAYMSFGISPDVVNLVHDYYIALVKSFGIVPMLAAVPSHQTSYAIEEPNIVLVVNLLRRALYLFFSYGLIFGRVGMPKCGISGPAYATSISAIFDQGIFMLYFFLNKTIKEKYGLFSLSWESLKKDGVEFLKKSSTLAFQNVNEFFINLFGIIEIGRIGDSELAAAEVAMQYNSILQIALITSSQVCAIQVGGYKNEFLNVSTIMKSAMMLTMIVPMIAIPVFSTIPNLLVEPFEDHSQVTDSDSDGDTDEISSVVRWLLLIVACNQIPNVVRQICSGALRGIGDFSTPTMVNFITMTGIGVLSSYLLGEVADLGPVGFFLGTTVGMTCSAAALLGLSGKKIMVSNDANFSSLNQEQNSLEESFDPNDQVKETSFFSALYSYFKPAPHSSNPVLAVRSTEEEATKILSVQETRNYRGIDYA